jgi:hypothetical protein
VANLFNFELCLFVSETFTRFTFLPPNPLPSIIEKCLNDAQLVNELQKEYCTERAYKVVLINNKGDINYVLAGREDI